jgi:hypothetical protein
MVPYDRYIYLFDRLVWKYDSHDNKWTLVIDGSEQELPHEILRPLIIPQVGILLFEPRVSKLLYLYDTKNDRLIKYAWHYPPPSYRGNNPYKSLLWYNNHLLFICPHAIKSPSLATTMCYMLNPKLITRHFVDQTINNNGNGNSSEKNNNNDGMHVCITLPNTVKESDWIRMNDLPFNAPSVSFHVTTV